MRLTIERDALLGALRTVLPAAPRQAAIAALSGARVDVDTDAGTATFTCTSLDFTIEHQLEGIELGEDEGGTVIAPAHLLTRLVASLPPGPVQLGTHGDRLVVIAGPAEAKLHTVDPDGWPKAPSVDGEPVELDERQLSDLRAIVPMASTDQARPFLTCVYFEAQRAFATDSYRLGIADLMANMPEASVPASALTTVLAAAGDGLTMTASGHFARFRAAPTTWVVSLVEAAKPAIDGLVRESSPHRLAVERRALDAAVKRATSIGLEDSDNGKKVRGPVSLTVEGDKLTVERHQAGVGVIDEALPCTSDWAGRLGYNPAYLRDLLASVDEEFVTLELVDALKPVIARSGRRLLLLMPVKMA